jgi:hypothetical protein
LAGITVLFGSDMVVAFFLVMIMGVLVMMVMVTFFLIMVVVIVMMVMVVLFMVFMMAMIVILGMRASSSMHIALIMITIAAGAVMSTMRLVDTSH